MTCLLVIDDEAKNRRHARHALAGMGLEILEASDGAEGLRVLEDHAGDGEHSVDIVVTDIFMPNQDGIETIMALRRAHPEVRIIATAETDDGHLFYLHAAEKLGAHATVVKPFPAEKLRHAVTLCLSPHSAFRPDVSRIRAPRQRRARADAAGLQGTLA